jgi:hypothetical protein
VAAEKAAADAERRAKEEEARRVREEEDREHQAKLDAMAEKQRLRQEEIGRKLAEEPKPALTASKPTSRWSGGSALYVQRAMIVPSLLFSATINQ